MGSEVERRQEEYWFLEVSVKRVTVGEWRSQLGQIVLTNPETC